MTPFETALKISREPRFMKQNLIYRKSWHWRYLLYRVARPCLKIAYRIFKATHPNRPWTSQASIRIFEALLTKGMRGFEYGSGNSTIFFAQRLGHLTSVEHNKEWSEIVQARLKELRISNVDYHFIPRQEVIPTSEYTFYRDFNLTERDFHIRREYHNYFSQISLYPVNHFDFVLVDGRARVECSLLAISRLKPGGMLVLDNSDRNRYEPVFQVLHQWKKVKTTTGLFDTTIWFKPESP